MRSESLKWVGGEHQFALTVPLLEALQDRCGGDGIGLIYHRLKAGVMTVQDVLATLALGLEGGGMKKQAAVTLVRTLAEDHGINPLSLPARAILGAALNGWPDEVPATKKNRVKIRKTSSSTPAK